MHTHTELIQKRYVYSKGLILLSDGSLAYSHNCTVSGSLSVSVSMVVDLMPV